MIQLGYAQQDITPGKPVDLCGFALRQGASTSAHDPIMIRWIALHDSSGQKVLLGSADLISFSRQCYQDLQKQICSSPDTASCNVGLATTHTHSAPVTVRLRYCGKINKSYLAATKDTIVSTGEAAVASPARSVKVALGTSTCDVIKNRRNPKSGLVDNEVITLAFIDPETEKPLGVLVNFACHPVVLGHKSLAVSADYPGYLAKHVEEQTGAPCLFMNGACGDINPVNDHMEDPSEAAKTGTAIAVAALKGLEGARLLSDDSLAWHRVQVQLPVRVPVSANDFEVRLNMLEARFGISKNLFADRVARDTQRLAEGTYPKAIALELSLLTIGDEAGILFVPGELFVSIGLRMKKMALPRKLIISGFSNGSVGYLSDRQAYVDGGYEPLFANFFYDFPEFDPSIEDVLLDAFGRLLAKAGVPAGAM